MLWINSRWYYHGGSGEHELWEVELGGRAAFDLFHHDDVMFEWQWLRAMDTTREGSEMDKKSNKVIRQIVKKAEKQVKQNQKKGKK